MKLMILQGYKRFEGGLDGLEIAFKSFVKCIVLCFISTRKIPNAVSSRESTGDFYETLG